MSLQRYDLIAPNGFYIIGNGVCRLTALHPLQGAFTHVMCVMKCNRKCKVWAESAFCILGRINPALRTREHANMRTCEHGVFAHVRVFACSRRIPPSPLEAVLNRRILAWSGTRTTSSPRKRHADGFGATFCHQKVAIRRGTRRGSVFFAGKTDF